MAKEVVSRCDECGTTEGVREFVIIVGEKPREVDLCPEHAAPLLKLYDLGVEAATSKPPATRPRKQGGHAVIAIEDWQEGQAKS
ncbi:hypothetical protein ACWGBV_18475 [Streptomyces sp. NPDC055051]